jgi:hypothetical protein
MWRGAARQSIDFNTLPDFASMWMIQNASMSSWVIIATTPTCGAKK